MPDAFLPGASSGGFVSHEAACVLNLGDDPVTVVFTFFFEDDAPVVGQPVDVAARRTRHLRLDDPAQVGGVELATDVPFAYRVDATGPVVVQHSRLDTSGGYALATTVAHPL